MDNLRRCIPRLCRTVHLHNAGYRRQSLSTLRQFSPSRRAIPVLGAAAGATLVSAYFLWPDASRSAPTYANAPLSPAHFSPVTVTSSEPCSDVNTRLITLTVPPQALPPLDGSIFAPIWSIYIKDDDIQVERPYTPLEGIDENGRMKLWIKRYPKGEVGRWLHTKNVGDRIEIRGPLKTYAWQQDVWDEVIMISGGTGITPFYQLIHHALLHTNNASKRTRFTLLHSSRTPGELPPAELLRPLVDRARQDPAQLRVAFFVDQKDGSEAEVVRLSDIHEGRIGDADIRRVLGDEPERTWWPTIFHWNSDRPTLPNDKKILFLVCGPEPMINAIAGPYGRNYSQGPVGGVLGQLGCRTEQVWKL